MKADYTLFDNALLATIRAGKTQFSAIASGRTAEFANTLAGKDRHGYPQGWRLIDRRLQAMRKAGKLAYDRKTGWSAA
jgi:hypothetical protein